MKDFGQFITERQVLTDQSRIFQTWTIHFNFSNVSAISWRPVLVVEEAVVFQQYLFYNFIEARVAQ
jgi:predicted RNA-binding protein